MGCLCTASSRPSWCCPKTKPRSSPSSRPATSRTCRSCRAARAPACRAGPGTCVAVVGPGVRNLAISEAAAPHGLYYAPDPSSQIACSIGGNVAENSGGVHCLKYGLTVHNVLRVRVVTIEGEIVELGGE